LAPERPTCYEQGMASYRTTVACGRSADDVFSYLSDFSSVSEWDPSISSAEHSSSGDPRTVGATFHVVTGKVVLDYATLELQRPGRIVLRGENNSMISLDTITIADRSDGGCEVTYAAELELKGLRKLADPVLQLAFKRLGDKARDGLRAKLNESRRSDH